ncbi:phage tail tube protein [Falsigemmobacter faecalis]|uniref:Outer capsid protein Hoc n=1 Tax=Falsigemmobacter faecalis TaxID=2488730 RepID=A0A3P3DCD4_9RHOB|nr:phage tail tube protein [Falsigemmobacter faecalis]RRH71995.1 outer capsid protein Hoc [Falsigemmobacter faecalis]
MAKSKASIGFNSKFGIKGAGDTYVMVAEVVSISVPNMSRETIDVTHLGSDDKTKEFIAGLKETGEAVITINFVPMVADVLVTAFEAEEGDYRILFPSGTTALDFHGIPTEYAIGELVKDDKMSATFTVKASGKATLTTVSAG